MSYGKPTDHYLIQRIQSASPEQLVAILLEGGQRYLGQAIKAIETKNYRLQASSLSRVGEFIVELALHLNLEGGSELAHTLNEMYDYWTLELFEASQTRDLVRLEALSRMMGDLRATWEELHVQKLRSAPSPEFLTGDRVV